MTNSNQHIILFTDKFPYGNTESFIIPEIERISEYFSSVYIFPLDAAGNYEKARHIPRDIEVAKPVFKNYKSKKDLIIQGLLNTSPLWPFVKEFFKSNCWKSLGKFRNWFAHLLVTRAAIHAFNSRLNKSQVNSSLLYFYWGLRWSQVIPFLPEDIRSGIIVRFHGSDLYEHLNDSYIPFRKEQLNRLDRAVFISEMGRKYLIDKYPFVANKSIVSRLGTEDFGVNPYKPATAFHMVSCSNLVPLKRIHLIAESLHQLGIPLKWTHFGSGPERNRILNEIKKLPGHIEAELQEGLEHSKLMEYYQAHSIDLFVNVSESEGIPVTIMEAMSFGIPILATNVGGTSEIVNENVGILVDANITPIRLAQTIDDLLNNPDYLKKRENARKYWEIQSKANNVYPQFFQTIKLEDV